MVIFCKFNISEIVFDGVSKLLGTLSSKSTLFLSKHNQRRLHRPALMLYNLKSPRRNGIIPT